MKRLVTISRSKSTSAPKTPKIYTDVELLKKLKMKQTNGYFQKELMKEKKILDKRTLDDSTKALVERGFKEESFFIPSDTFYRRHTQTFENKDTLEMLKTLNIQNVDELVDKTVPKNIYNKRGVHLGDKKNRGESEILEEVKLIGERNKLLKSLIGTGYYNTLLPNVILRNVFEDPSWYSSYTPYQAEISQGRLEALINYQTVISDMTGFPISNASLLDEGTAAAEAMAMCEGKEKKFFASEKLHPQTLAVVKTRADSLGFELIIGDHKTFDQTVCGAILQYPDTDGNIHDFTDFIKKVHDGNGIAICATDLLALTILKSPAEIGFDIAVGSNQRFGLPLGYGGPHAGFISTTDKLKRKLPGRIIGVAKDVHGNLAYRMSLQTREQHIRREKASSNICTAQALLAIGSQFYAIYHGPTGLKKIAENAHKKAVLLSKFLKIENGLFFDTLKIKVDNADEIHRMARKFGYNLREIDSTTVGLSVDESTTVKDIDNILEIFGVDVPVEEFGFLGENLIEKSAFQRTSKYLTHPVFNKYQTEHELQRYIFKLKNKDLALNQAMIPLGSCTMKLNSTSELIPFTWKEFNSIHPFVPKDQARGYTKILEDLGTYLCQLTGFDGISFQPNAGSQGEYAGLLTIRNYQKRIGQGHRDVCLIPSSAHGTNPASARLVSMKIVVVKTLSNGDIDVDDLKRLCEIHKDNLSCLMVTYPSTFGIFEETIKDICNLVHQNGGQVYMDGANMNAQVGLTSPGYIGADVCHLNLHKTFCIPHGGGGPGMGPICVKKHLIKSLPSHCKVDLNTEGPSVSSAPYGSPSILLISYMYIKLMGSSGLRDSTKMAILNANYMAKRLESHYNVVYKGKNGTVAHEFIIDIRPFKKFGIESVDVSKRLMDYGFHAPTNSFPIANTLMIEPTESETKEEMDRYCDALISIRNEIREIEEGKFTQEDNVIVNAPHTCKHVTSSEWNHKYSREKAAFPAQWLSNYKYWPTVGRIEESAADRNLICTCPPIESYQ
jgi:glycine dehydrogenase